MKSRRLLAALTAVTVASVLAAAPVLALVGTDTWRSVTFVPGSSTVAWAAGDNGKLIKTADGGATWTNVASGYTSRLMDVAFGSTTNGLLIGNTGTNTTVNPLKRTTNSGSTWLNLPFSGPANDYLFRNVELIGATGWVAGSVTDGPTGETRAALLKSTTSGTSWSEVFRHPGEPIPEPPDPPIPPASTTVFNGVDFYDSNNGWAVGGSAVTTDIADYPIRKALGYRTTNGGSSWTTMTVSNTPNIELMDVSFVSATSGLAVGVEMGTSSDKSAIFYTNNGGSTWTRFAGTLPAGAVMGVDFVSPTVAYAVGARTYGSYNHRFIVKGTLSGSTWTWTVQQQYIAKYLTDVDFADVNNGIAVGDAGTVLYTRDGGVSWSEGVAATGGGTTPPDPPAIPVTRVYSDDRYLTSVAVSKATYNSANTVVIAAGKNFPDALAASGLAGQANGPLLLTGQYSVPQGVIDEIKRLGAKKAYVVGGSSVVAEAVRQQLATAMGVSLSASTVPRIYGINRFETAEAIAKEITNIRVAKGLGAPKTVFIANGRKFADALAVSPYSNSQGYPILLTESDSLPLATSREIKALGATRAIVAGGAVVVSDGVRQSVATAMGATLSSTTVPRWSGIDRYETARVIATNAIASGWGHSAATVGVATGENFPDALGGGVMVGVKRGALLLTKSATLSPSVNTFVSANKASIARVYVYGGLSAVSSTTFNGISALF